jgi:hypothetical protein
MRGQETGIFVKNTVVKSEGGEVSFRARNQESRVKIKDLRTKIIDKR